MFLNKLFKKHKHKTKLKDKLYVEQMDGKVVIAGQLSRSDYKVIGLKLTSPSQGEDLSLKVQNDDNNRFKFDLDLKELSNQLLKEASVYSLSLIVNVHKDHLTEKQMNHLNEKASTHYHSNDDLYEYPIRLGRFKNTITGRMDSTLIDGRSFKLYKTVKGNLSLAVDTEVVQPKKVQINELKSKKNRIILSGKLFTRTETINDIKLLIKGRETNVEVSLPVKFEHMVKETQARFGLNRYEYKSILYFNVLYENGLLQDDIYDLYVRIHYHGYTNSEETDIIRIGGPRFRARFNVKSSRTVKDDKVISISPYYTFRGHNLSFETETFDKGVYRYLTWMMRFSFIVRLLNKRKDIWIVGERRYKSQDTGYHFFKYIRKNNPDKHAYYVIDSDSPEAANVIPHGNVIYFKSKEHIKAVLSAKKIIGSHHPDYLYPLRTTEFKNKVKAQKVFLQHGVMGTKNMVANYGKNVSSFDTDLFLVSSQSERKMIVNDFGYEADEVKVTGLSRFDSLFKQDVQLKRQVLIIPTWREWLVREEVFLESEYYQRYLDLVNNKKLHDLAKQHHFDIVFCLHPNMQNFSHLFQNPAVRIVNQGEVNVQTLLKESMLMITDYSSVAFDFSFLERPIIYYQFDRQRFIGNRPSHLNLDRDLPGDIVDDMDQVIDLVNEYATNDFEMKPEYQKRANQFIEYKDQYNSKRIYDAIETFNKKEPLHKKILKTELYKALFNRFRKSKYYLRIMKKYYLFASRFLSIDENLILFESGVGKQLGDNPKYIYDEIVDREMNYKKIWVVNGLARYKDIENTKLVKRLSPSYFYYLAKAKIWVNNQNFPTYIMKRPETIYLQTWHGTPLKKMLFDVKNVKGREEGYLDRVSKAVGDWDYLVSPSPYASQAFRSAFHYDGNILETGYPRNDVFYRSDQEVITNDIKVKLNIPSNKKVILYAPTFRDNQTTGPNKFVFDIVMDLYKMREALGEEYVILLRMHVVVSNKIKIDEELEDFVMDVSTYSDMQELLLISDILITDYSSAMFDFANTQKPMLFFTFDYDIYKNNVRGFYMNFEEEAPGPFVTNTDEIIDSIHHLDDVIYQYQEKYDKFYQKYCELEDGNASKRVVDYLINQHKL